MNRGRLFIISGPSGIGKDTVLCELFKQMPDLKMSISTVTRPMREGEVQDGKYHFTSAEEFREMIATDRLLEYNEYVGNYYGTPKQPVLDWIEQGYDVILEIDVNGAMNVLKKYPTAVSIFMIPTDMNTLYERLRRRGTESEQAIAGRMSAASRELSFAHKYDFIMYNDTLPQAVNDLKAIIRASALLRDNMLQNLNEVEKDAESFNRQAN